MIFASPLVTFSDMSSPEVSEAEQHETRWLTAEQLASWLSFVRVLTWLPWSIDQQLQRDSKLKMVEYQVLAMLSESPAQTMRMSSLAEVTNASLSRLSHLVDRLEKRGFVRREPDRTDGRFTNAILTEKGRAIAGHRRPHT
jgi:DNA-binding MarR family transcriptional regulator